MDKVGLGSMTTNSTAGLPGGDGWFVTTHWSVVLSARETGSSQSADALEKLCRTYWFPLYAYVRRLGHSPADAEDLIQGFFTRLLQKDYLAAADQEKGRFRSFLLTALKRSMANEWDRQHAQKRGGFAKVVALDQDAAESRFAAENIHELSPDVLFDRQWAVALLDQTVTRLREEYLASGRASLFEYLQPCLAKEESALSYAEIAKRLNLTEAAVKMAVHRLRARYRELLREQIAQTVASAEDLEQELRDLFASFS